jgi:adenylate cyclase
MKKIGISPGVNFSASTRRAQGFTDDDIALLRDLMVPFAAAAHAGSMERLTRTLLDAYLGAMSGSRVLDGQIMRGDSQLIDCVLWYCDMRDSTPLAEAMPMERYFQMVNTYLECTAGAVLDHGGEVLRFVGDAVFAIFPHTSEKPSADVARAAKDAALAAVARVGEANAAEDRTYGPPIRFGIALHAGQVMYGNVGTENRLEFSVTGPAANEVARLEGLCKSLHKNILASGEFQALLPDSLEPLGHHEAAGIKGGLEVYAMPAKVD